MTKQQKHRRCFIFIELVNFSFFSISGWRINLDYGDFEWFALEMKWDHSVIFESAPEYCISDSSVDYEGYSISSKEFLPTVVDITVIWIKFTHSCPFQFTDFQDVSIHSCLLLLDHVQFIMIHGPNVLSFYAILFFTASDFIFTTRPSTAKCCFCFGPATSFFLDLLVIILCSSLVVYWIPSDLGAGRVAHLLVSYLFAFSYCSWSSPGKNTGVGCCFTLHQWTTFFQNPSLCPVCLGWPCMAWLIVSLSYASLLPWQDCNP